MLAVGNAFTVIVVGADVAEQLLMSVTVTVYVPEDEILLIDAPVDPLLHK
jgi:hypothetical protein